MYVCMYIYIYTFIYIAVPYLAGAKRASKKGAPMGRFNGPDSCPCVRNTYTLKRTDTCHGSRQGCLLVGACARQWVFGSIFTNEIGTPDPN